MVKVRNFSFELDGNKSVFYPGQWVSGVCQMDLIEGFKIKSFCIKLVGEACLRQKRDGPVTKKEMVTPTQTETIYTTASLKPGQQEHAFNFQIPPVPLPTSFEGEYGFIRYSVQGIVERPWKNNITTRRVITVWEYLDCNNPLLSAPQEGNLEKVIPGGLFSSSKRNYLTLKSDRRGYCPGESILLSVKCEDFPPGIIQKAMLTMISKFGDSKDRRPLVYRKVLSTVNVGTTPADKVYGVDNIKIDIPSMPPTIKFRGSSGIGISVNYLVEFQMFSRSKGNKKPKPYWHVHLPITIGTIPLNPANVQQSHEPLSATLSAPRPSSTDSGEMDYGDEQLEPPPYSELAPSAPPLELLATAPPPYEESILGAANISHAPDDYGDSSYTPVYTIARGSRPNYNSFS